MKCWLFAQDLARVDYGHQATYRHAIIQICNYAIAMPFFRGRALQGLKTSFFLQKYKTRGVKVGWLRKWC